MSKRFLIIIVALFAVVGFFQCTNENPSVTQEVINFLFIYKDDSTKTKADNFKTFIENDGPDGSQVTLVEIADISTTNFSSFEVIIIGPDTCDTGLANWGDATKDAEVEMIYDSGKPILALGAGGSKYYQRIDDIPLDTLEVNYMYCGNGNAQEFRVEDDTMAVWKTPNDLGVSTGDSIQVTTTTGGPIWNTVNADGNQTVFSVDNTNTNYAVITVEDDRFVYWASSNDPSNFTDEGKNLFVNVLEYASGL
jgi:hypothetical protein